MDETMLQQLATFLGVEGTPEAILAGLQDLITKITAMADAGGGEPPIPEAQMAELRSAAGAKDNTVLVERLTAFRDALNSHINGEGAGLKVEALASFAAAFDKAAKDADAEPSNIPYLTNDAPDGKKSRKYGVNVVSKPSTSKTPLADAVVSMVRASRGDGDAMKSLKAMDYSIGVNGGWVARRETADELLEKFYAAEVCFKLGATKVPMDGIESLTYRKHAAGATAYWGGRAQSTTQSEETFGLVNLNLRELVCEVRIPNRLLKVATINLEQLIRNDLEKAMSLTADLAFLRGSGSKLSGHSGIEPLGILNTTGVTSTAIGTNGKVPSPKDFIDGWGRIEDANVPASPSWGAALTPRTKRTLENTTDTTGQLIPTERFTNGHKVEATTQIPNNLTVGSGTNCSEVYLGAWEYLIIGVGQDIELVVDESVYRATRETLIQAVMMVDCGVAYPTAFQVLTGVKA